MPSAEIRRGTNAPVPPSGTSKADLKHQAAQRSAQVAALDDGCNPSGVRSTGYSLQADHTQTDHALALATGSSAVAARRS